jgi:hypothetical protein
MTWSMLLVAKFFRCRVVVGMWFLATLLHTTKPNGDVLVLRAYYALESNSCQRPIRSTGLSPIEIDSCTKNRASSALDS